MFVVHFFSLSTRPISPASQHYMTSWSNSHSWPLFAMPLFVLKKTSIIEITSITPAMRNLHWLPIPARETFKLCSLMYNIFSHRAPTYMASLIKPSNQTGSRGLRSTSRGDAVVPKTNWNYGKRAFAVAGPTAWNSLPVQIWRVNTVTKFKSALKTHLFSLHYYPSEDWYTPTYFIFSLFRYNYYVLSPSCKTLVLFRRVAKCQLYCIVLYCIALHCIALYFII